MARELSPVDLAAVREIIARSNLRSIEFYEVGARKHETPPDEEVEGQLQIEVQQRSDATSFGVRLNARLVLPAGEANACVAGEYDLEEGFVPTDRSLRLFANEVAVMTVYPYLREAVATTTARVFGNPLHLPLVQRGEVALDVDDNV